MNEIRWLGVLFAVDVQSEDAKPSPGWPDVTIEGVTGPFTSRSQVALNAAREAAQMYRHGYVGTEHLLLGLLEVEEGVAARVLGKLGITIDRARAWIDYRIGKGNTEVELAGIVFAPRTTRALQLAVEEHKALGHLDVGTEHLLPGVSHVEDGSGAKFLTDSGVGYDALREAVTTLLAQGTSRSTLVVCSLPPDLVSALDRLAQSSSFETRAEAAAWCIEAAIRTRLQPPLPRRE